MWSIIVLASSALLISAVQSQTVDCSARPNMHPCDCCPAKPAFMTPELAAECGLPPMPAAGSRPPMPPGGGDGPRGPPCEAVKCMMNKFNLLVNDKINRPQFLTFMQQQYGAEWTSIIQSVAQTCNAEVDANTSDCEPQKYLGCFKANVVKNCPASIWVQSDDCAKMKSFLQNCPMPGRPM